MPGQNRTTTWENKLAQLVAGPVPTPPPAQNAVNARLTDIDGAGTANLVSKLKDGEKEYNGFALIFHHPTTDHQNYEWLQFITRQLVVNDNAIKGNLVNKTNTTCYQLVDSAAEITDYTLESGPKPSNWNSCWNVDAGIITGDPNPLFRETYEYVLSTNHNVTAVLDLPTPLIGKSPTESEKKYYLNLPVGDSVPMREAVGSGQGVARAYFSDYLLKKDGNNYRILARFDFYLTWNPVTKTAKPPFSFSVHSVKATPTTELLECHKEAMLHKANGRTPDNKEYHEQPWKPFYDKIVS